MLLDCGHTGNWSIADIADIADIITGLFTAGFAFYIFRHQWRKDEADKKEAILLNEETIRLQWFKELIIQPHLVDIKLFYSALHSLEGKLSIDSYFRKENICDFIKEEGAKFRKSFIDSLLAVDHTLYNGVKEKTDELIDIITFEICNSGKEFHQKEIFEREIGSRIVQSRKDLINKIYNFKGNAV